MISKKWLQRSCLTVFCLLVFSGWSGRLWAGAADTVTVTIEQAEKTEYLKDADSGEEVIRFTGDVSLTVDNQGTKTVIQAETVTFNRARATVYASGNVQFTQTGDGRNTETLTAQSLLFNTRTLEGVFDNGRVVQESSGNINLPTGSVLVVFAESFGRENSGTVTFRSGSLTFCDDPDPHWKIDASRIWLLPGNEFAIFSGFLYVGHFPVLYIPFFYYPKDEMIFNPSFGYDGRKGYFTQTTTYIIGRKGLSDSSSSEEDEGLFSFMKTTTLKEQEREGLFLHNLDADAVMPDNSLKILVDGYSNLGYMAGVEGSFKTAGNFSDIAFGSYIGMSRTLFPVNSFYGSYTTLSPTDQQYWDSGWFLGMRTPFRFGASVKTSYNNKPFSFTLSLPVYSDPYFTSDFLADRSESMDWINFLMNNVATGGNLASLADAGTSSTLSSYAWSLNGSVSTPQFISHLNPWVTEFSVSNTSSINFASKVNDSLSGETASYDPNRYFYYPSAVLPLKASMRIGGKLFTMGNTMPGTASGSIPDLELPASDESAISQDPAPVTDSTVPSDLVLLEPPALTVSQPSTVAVQGIQAEVTYSIAPSVTTEVNYDASSFTSPEDIRWDDVKNRYLQIKCPVTVKNTASWRGGFMGLTNTYEFLPVYQVHTDVSDAFYTQTALSQMQEADLKARTLNLNNTNSLTIKPFQYVSALSGSSVSWNTGIKLVRTDFTGTVDDPEWKYRLAGWDTDSFSAHNLTGVLAATQRSQKFKESLTLKVNLPPLNRRYETIAAVSFPYCTSLSVSTAWKLNDDDVWVYEPLSQSSSWALLDKKLTVSQSYRYNREDEHSESLSVAASGYGASVTYNMLYTTPYEYVSQNGWVAKTEKEFLPYSINMRYAMSGFTWSRLNDAITLKPSVTSSLAMDLIRPTQSNFTVSSGLTFKITEFLTITVAAESQNKVVYRYVQRYFGSDVTLPGQENIFLDLMDSFAFWNPVARQNSGFKMRSFSVNLDHNLHDWTLHSEFKVSPRLIKDTGVPEYDYSPYFILSVKWNPMSSLKTTIQDNYGEFVLNPSDK